MNQGIGIGIDLVIIVVMGMAVFYAVRLNRALTRARDGRAELIQLIASLSDALSRADMAVKTMKGTATEYELSLQKHMAVTQGLIEELGLINDTGNGIANRLERLAPLARAGVSEMSYDTEPRSTPARSLPPLRAERLGEASPTPPVAKAASPAERPASPVITRPANAAVATQAPAKKGVVSLAARMANAGIAENVEEKPRSRAERELFDALETLRKGKPS
jgi:hypothetical protein